MIVAPISSTKEQLRIAILCTPRVGNTWFRQMIDDLYGLNQEVLTDLHTVDFDTKPSRYIFTSHFNYDPLIEQKLHRHGFHTIVMARHPLDMLISFLHVTQSISGGDEPTLYGASPRNRMFINYAKTDRAHKLFHISTEWWNRDGVISLRYEDLVADPEKELQQIANRIGGQARKSISEVVKKYSMDHLRQLFPYQKTHFWKGKPGQWRELLTKAEVLELADSLDAIAKVHDYTFDYREDLTADQADLNWNHLAGQELVEAVRKEALHRQKMDQEFLPRIHHLEKSLTEMTQQRDAIHLELKQMSDTAERLFDELQQLRSQPTNPKEASHAEQVILSRRLSKLTQDLQRTQEHFKHYEGLGRVSTKVARLVQRIINAVRVLTRTGKYRSTISSR